MSIQNTKNTDLMQMHNSGDQSVAQVPAPRLPLRAHTVAAARSASLPRCV